jgi:acyl-CoA thioesterase-1
MNRGLKPMGVLLVSIITTWACLASFSVIAADRAVHEPEYDEVGDPSLPRVLLIGDSISMGYTPGVRALLKDQVNVHRPAANCGATFIGLRDLDKWLDGRTWDIIHFNFGVHDLRYCFDGNPYKMSKDGIYPTSESGAPRTSLADYHQNLETLVQRLNKTGAKLIWATTTPIGEYYHGYDPVMNEPYNKAAIAIMKKNQIEINDLHSVIAANISTLQGPDHIHCNTVGCQVLAEQVAKRIREKLSE